MSTLATLATLIVWLVWLQLMYSDYRQQRQPRILIHQAPGFSTNSHCLLVNLSRDVIHIQCVRAALVGEEGEDSFPLGGDVELPTDKSLAATELENALRQGPLGQGEFLRLGTFEDILERVAGTPAEGRSTLSPDSVASLTAVEIRVVAVYGRSDRSVGARRRFRLEGNEDRLRVRPEGAYTEQLYSRRDRRITEKWHNQCLED